MIYLKFHNTPEGDIIAMCDSELIGKSFKQAKVEIDLKTYADFYKGDLIPEAKVEAMPDLNDFYTANIVGARSVGIFEKRGIISKDEIKKVKDVPYVHLYKLI